MYIATIGIDLAKSVFQIYGIESYGSDSQNEKIASAMMPELMHLRSTHYR